MYTVAMGLESHEVSDEAAHLAYDVHPAADRSGEREGAFILWWRNRAGFRCIPVLFRPKAVS